jgi:hypothetical protein
MPVNLRSIPIEGYITDNAGNILRNADVVIKDDTPAGSIVVDTVKSDDDGYFISRPIKNGVYDIYESGVRVYRQYHSSNPTVIQCYNPGSNNIPSSIRVFSDYVGNAEVAYDINQYRYYIQIEPEYIDIATYGHMFPIWNVDPQSGLANHPFLKITTIHPEITTANSSRLTHTRFDVEFFAPLYAQNSTHRKIRWSGIPGVMFYEDSRIVLPLDYYSIIPNHFLSQFATTQITEWAVWQGDQERIVVSLPNEAIAPFYDLLVLGDIVELELANGLRFWCIVYHKEVTSGDIKTAKIWGRMWKSSNTGLAAQGTPDLSYIKAAVSDMYVRGFRIYQGMFSGLSSLTSSVGEFFSVQENQAAQNMFGAYPEAYTYDKV